MGNSCGCIDTCGGNGFIWLILILLLCGGEGCCNICGGGCDNGFIWIILILILFGGCFGNCGMCEAK